MTDETKAEIVKRFADGESFGVLGKAYGVSRNKIAGIVNRYGRPRGAEPTVRKPMNHCRRRKYDHDAIRDLLGKGLRKCDVARQVGCPWEIVDNISRSAAA